MKFAVAGLICLGLTAAAHAQQSLSWNGEWAGNWQGGNGAQLIFAGNELIGVYWRRLSQPNACRFVGRRRDGGDRLGLRRRRADPRRADQRPYCRS
jgi:hypothetical protein